MTNFPDVRISDHGSIVILTGLTNDGRLWLDDNLQAGPMWGGGHAVEARYVNPVLEGMQDAGISFSSIF